MTTREYLLDCATARIGAYGKGSDEVLAIWRDVLQAIGENQLKQFSETQDWCGGFVLSCLREAKLTDTHWVIGSGFVLRLLGAKSATKSPRPGDIGIRVGPKGHEVYHHFIVERWNGPKDWSSIDGNSPHVARKNHTSLDATTVFYSIEKLLPTIPEAGFTSDSPFAVPGVQENNG